MAKGGEFERRICKMLSAWWLGNDTEDVCFWRTAMSGGRATVRRKSGRDTNRAHCGDLGALDERGAALTRFITWELKRGYNHAHIHALIDAPNGAAIQPYAAWIAQARESAANAKSPYWMIIHARDRRVPTVTMPGLLAAKLGLDARPGVQIDMGGGAWYHTTTLDMFLDVVKPDTIRRMAGHKPRS